MLKIISVQSSSIIRNIKGHGAYKITTFPFVFFVCNFNLLIMLLSYFLYFSYFFNELSFSFSRYSGNGKYMIILKFKDVSILQVTSSPKSFTDVLLLPLYTMKKIKSKGKKPTILCHLKLQDILSNISVSLMLKGVLDIFRQSFILILAVFDDQFFLNVDKFLHLFFFQIFLTLRNNSVNIEFFLQIHSLVFLICLSCNEL